jgi:hypothetical protein
MLKKLKWPLILAAIGAVIYFLFIKNKTAVSLATANNTVDPVVVKRYPPPGYAGPSDKGPYYWAGMGSPPDGKFEVLGYTRAEAIAKGYPVD